MAGGGIDGRAVLTQRGDPVQRFVAVKKPISSIVEGKICWVKDPSNLIDN